jgi:hypothetical protein
LIKMNVSLGCLDKLVVDCHDFLYRQVH